MFIMEDGFEDSSDGESDGVVGCAFAGDDAVGGVFDVLEDVVAVVGGELSVSLDGPLLEGEVADVGAAPEGDFGVAMFAGDVGMDVLDGDFEVFGDEESESGAVEDGAAAEDSFGVEAADFECGVGEDIDGIADHEEDGCGGELEEFGEGLAADVDVGGGEVQASLSGFLLGAGGEDDDIGVLGEGEVIAADDGGHGHELHAVVEVEDFSVDLLAVDVMEGDLLGDAADEAGIGDGGADAAGSDDGDFVGAFGHEIL